MEASPEVSFFHVISIHKQESTVSICILSKPQ